MTQLLYIDSAGPALAVNDAHLSRIASGVFNPPLTSINVNLGTLGTEHPNRRIFMICAGNGPSYFNSATVDGVPVDFFDKYVGGYASTLGVCLISFLKPTGASCVVNIQASPPGVGGAQNFILWTLYALAKNIQLVGEGDNHHMQSSNFVLPISCNVRGGGLLIGGMANGNASDMGVSNIANSNESWVSSSRNWAMWENSLSTQTGKTVVVDVDTGASGYVQGKLWAFR